MFITVTNWGCRSSYISESLSGLLEQDVLQAGIPNEHGQSDALNGKHTDMLTLYILKTQ